MVCHSVPAMPMTKRPRAGLPGAPTRLPKVPLRFRALGGVDPRSLPPGTPYPCNDPAVGASVRGKHFAGKVLGCATPPPGKRGRHFVVGGLESRSAIASAKRASERAREALRARYEGPDFDARPKRRAPKSSAPVAGPRPSAVKRSEELPLPKPVFMRRTPEMSGPAWSPKKPGGDFDRQKVLDHIEQYDDGIAYKREKGEAIPQDWIDSRAALVSKLRGESAGTGIASLPVFGHPQATTVRPEKYGYLVPIRVRDAATLERRLGEVQALFAELASKISRAMDDAKSRDSKKSKAAKAYLASAQRGEDEVIRDLLHNETRGELSRLLKLVKRQEVSTGPRRSTVTRREELPLPKPVFMRRTPEMSGPAWSPPAPKKARKAAPAAVKAITSMPTDDAARMDEAEAILTSAFGPVARQTFAPGFHSLPATRFAAADTLSLAEAVVTPSFKPKGESSDAKVFVARLHERPGVYAFWISKSNPDMLRGVGGGDPPTQLVGADWKKNLKRAIAKK